MSALSDESLNSPLLPSPPASPIQVGIAMTDDPRPLVYLSIDVEDYFVSPETIPFSTWESYEDRLAVGLQRFLEVCEETGARSTLFWIGWEAERHPDWVRRFHDAGHETATHTWNHDYVHSLDEPAYRASLTRSVELLESLTGEKVLGHRAPAWSLPSGCTWAVDALLDCGIRYDSSIYPIRTYLYGEKGGERFPHHLEGTNGRRLREIPPTAPRLLGRTLPPPGGGFLRALPLVYHRWALARYAREGHTPMVYVHPWELDPDHPPLDLPPKQARVHSLGHRTTLPKLRALLRRYRGVPLREFLDKED